MRGFHFIALFGRPGESRLHRSEASGKPPSAAQTTPKPVRWLGASYSGTNLLTTTAIYKEPHYHPCGSRSGRVLHPVGDWACCLRTPKPSQRIAPRRSRGHREGADMTKWCADATPTPPLHSSLRALSCANHSPELRTHTSSCALQLTGAYFLVLRGIPQADEIYNGSNLKSNRALMHAKGTLWHLSYHVRVWTRV